MLSAFSRTKCPSSSYRIARFSTLFPRSYTKIGGTKLTMAQIHVFVANYLLANFETRTQMELKPTIRPAKRLICKSRRDHFRGKGEEKQKNGENSEIGINYGCESTRWRRYVWSLAIVRGRSTQSFPTGNRQESSRAFK